MFKKQLENYIKLSINFSNNLTFIGEYRVFHKKRVFFRFTSLDNKSSVFLLAACKTNWNGDTLYVKTNQAGREDLCGVNQEIKPRPTYNEISLGSEINILENSNFPAR